MLFNSELFLFIFLPSIFLLFYTLKKGGSNFILLLASMLFYAWGEPRFFPVILLSVLIDYWLGAKIAANQYPRLFITIGVCSNAFLLIYFKYMDFFISATNSFLPSHEIPLLNIALPIGVSFIVFEKITYLVDIYRKHCLPATSIASYLLYVFLFPKLLAGPIIKYHDIAHQLNGPTHKMKDVGIGFKRFLLGLVKKVLLADTLGEVADAVFDTPANELIFLQAWFGVSCYTLQIYMDFSAYSDMAIGLCRMFGFRLLENFNMPYISKNFTEFWRRWHISLSSWIKEYLYLPMGGNKKGGLRTYFNLWVCFLLSGLWHGASWIFVLWGAYNGIFLIIDKLFWVKASRKLPGILNRSVPGEMRQKLS
ncbi:MAG: MBOAT family O-acyltransferase [Gammaproteobacteria bacterium]